jgi:hypothetical protein
LKLVNWVDENGCKRRSLIRDSDPEHTANHGIHKDIPNLDELDWDRLRRNLHNNLFDNNLFTREDVQKSQNGITNAILATFRKEIVYLYRRQGKE